MTAKEARKCIAILEKTFGWIVYFYSIPGDDLYFYDIKRAGFEFNDSSSYILFDEKDTSSDYEGSLTEAEAVKTLVSEVSGNIARDRGGLLWKVPEFSSAAELKLKLAAMDGGEG